MALVRKYFLHGLIVSILLGGLFAYLGVYNTDTIPFFNRFVFWVSTMLVGNLSTGLLIPLVFNHWLPNRPVIVQLSCIVVLISIPVTFVLAAYDHNHGLDWSLNVWLVQYRYVVVISAILIFVGYFMLRSNLALEEKNESKRGAENEPDIARKLEQQFLKRLALKHHEGQLLAVKSEDHYLRVFTSVGEELILMRLSDAIEALDSVPGMQTHRSWWVARSAIADMQRKQGKIILTIVSGVEIPVSRTYEKVVKESINTI